MFKETFPQENQVRSSESLNLSSECHLCGLTAAWATWRCVAWVDTAPQRAWYWRQGRLAAPASQHGLAVCWGLPPHGVDTQVLSDVDGFWFCGCELAWPGVWPRTRERTAGRSSLAFSACRWFDVLQKVSTQLKTGLTGAAKNRADKVSRRPQLSVLSTSQLGCLKC